MAVKMRLRREGKKKQPFYRVVVADVRSPRDGRFIEDLGYYHPLRNPSEISIDRERALYWLNNGVQPSQAVVNLLRIEGIWEEFKPGSATENEERRAKRAAKREKQEAKLEASRKQQAEAAAEAARARNAAAEAAAQPDTAEADPVEEAPEEAVEQAAEEVTQPDPEPAEDAGALPEAEAEEPAAEEPAAEEPAAEEPAAEEPAAEEDAK
jgi:small subunit ribosomal protein S16